MAGKVSETDAADIEAQESAVDGSQSESTTTAAVQQQVEEGGAGVGAGGGGSGAQGDGILSGIAGSISSMFSK